jgi:hypothetical protein
LEVSVEIKVFHTDQMGEREDLTGFRQKTGWMEKVMGVLPVEVAAETGDYYGRKDLGSHFFMMCTLLRPMSFKL